MRITRNQSGDPAVLNHAQPLVEPIQLARCGEAVAPHLTIDPAQTRHGRVGVEQLERLNSTYSAQQPSRDGIIRLRQHCQRHPGATFTNTKTSNTRHDGSLSNRLCREGAPTQPASLAGWSGRGCWRTGQHAPVATLSIVGGVFFVGEGSADEFFVSEWRIDLGGVENVPRDRWCGRLEAIAERHDGESRIGIQGSRIKV